MTRTIAFIILIGVLLSLAVGEQLWIKNVYGRMLNETTEIIRIVDATPDTYLKEDFKFDDYLKVRADNLHHYWRRKEKNMGIIIRHIDLSYISDALIYARNFIHFDNKEEAMAGLSRLEYLLDSYKGVFGFNGVNIL